MRKHILSVLGYIVGTLGVQGTSHFLVFSSHYAEVAHASKQPVFALGISSMIIQGLILSFVFSRSKFYTKSLFDAVKVTWLFGLYLVSYVALAESGKYIVPNIPSWIGVEILVGSIQFTVIGVLMGLAHRKREAL